VWQEIARGLMEAKPSRMFEVLRECGALARVMPEVDALWDDADTAHGAMAALDAAAQARTTLPARFSVLARPFAPLAVESLAARIKVPADCRDLALLAARHANTVLDAEELDAESTLDLFNAVDAWRRPERFAELLTAAFAGAPNAAPARARLERARAAAAAVNAGEIAKAAKAATEIRGDVNAARLEAIRHALRGGE
jgi:tRNA nucleotidyltransferase (CCA-adding enzyme)